MIDADDTTLFVFDGPVTTDYPQLNVRIPNERVRSVLKMEALRQNKSLSELVMDYLRRAYESDNLAKIYGPLLDGRGE